MGQFTFGKLVKLVDAETLDIHLRTRDSGWLPDRSYVALCGKNFFAASMVEPGLQPCAGCAEYLIPGQRRLFFK